MRADLKLRLSNALRRGAYGWLGPRQPSPLRERLAAIWTDAQSDEHGLRLTAERFTDQELLTLDNVGRVAVNALRADYGDPLADALLVPLPSGLRVVTCECGATRVVVGVEVKLTALHCTFCPPAEPALRIVS